MVNLICKIISLLALVALVIPSFMYLADKISLEQVKNAMLIFTVVWFITASVWMWKNDSAA
jgi:hypothetical protein